MGYKQRHVRNWRGVQLEWGDRSAVGWAARVFILTAIVLVVFIREVASSGFAMTHPSFTWMSIGIFVSLNICLFFYNLYNYGDRPNYPRRYPLVSALFGDEISPYSSLRYSLLGWFNHRALPFGYKGQAWRIYAVHGSYWAALTLTAKIVTLREDGYEWSGLGKSILTICAVSATTAIALYTLKKRTGRKIFATLR